MNICEKCGKEYKSHGMTVELRIWHSGEMKPMDGRMWGRNIGDSHEIRGLCPECADILMGYIHALSWAYTTDAKILNLNARIPKELMELVT